MTNSKIPTKSKTLALLTTARQDPRNETWVAHSICVGDTAAKIATALNKSGQHLDVEKTTILGYLHDIGKMVGPFEKHPQNGYQYLKSQGYDDAYCAISLTHSYLNNDPFCVASVPPNCEPDQFTIDFIKNHPYTLEEKLINLCDLMCKYQVYTIDKRLIDIIIRHGAWKGSSYHAKETYRLKAYFDQLLGYNLYDLFPEIKENL